MTKKAFYSGVMFTLLEDAYNHVHEWLWQGHHWDFKTLHKLSLGF
jgi:hypothetical protein